MQTSRIVHTLTGHNSKIYAGQFTLDGEKIVTGSHDRTLRLWNASNGYSVRVIPCKSSVNALSISENDGNLCATAHLDKCIRFWDLKSGVMVHEASGVHTQQATCAQFSADGTMVVTSSRDNTLALIDTRTYGVIRTLKAYETKMGTFKNPVKYVVQRHVTPFCVASATQCDAISCCALYVVQRYVMPFRDTPERLHQPHDRCAT
jgi:autophagy-related protein 16